MLEGSNFDKSGEVRTGNANYRPVKTGVPCEKWEGWSASEIEPYVS